MKERNKSIFRILLFASVGILLAQTVLLVVLGDDAEVRIVLPVIIFFSELITGGSNVFLTLNPQYNSTGVTVAGVGSVSPMVPTLTGCVISRLGLVR